MDSHKKTLLHHQADPVTALDAGGWPDGDDLSYDSGPLLLTHLPTEVLLHIFSYLNINERLRAAGVCRQWRHLIYSSSRLWGSKQLRLKCSRQSQQSRRSIFYARRLGHHLRKLTVSCEHPDNHQCKYMAICFRKLVKSLYSKRPALTSLKIIDLRLVGATQVIITKVTAALTSLLNSLSNLKSFQMSSAHWPPEEGTVVIETLLKASRNSLETLQMDSFFLPRYVPPDFDRLARGIAALTRLSKLAIDYSYLTGDIVVALADSRRGQLKKLKLLAGDISPNTQYIPTWSWQYLTNACPALKVDFCIKGFVISPSRSIPAILDPAMRISMIRLSIGSQFTFMDTPRLNMAAVLQHITTNFRKRLVRFEMDIDNHNDFLDAGLIKLVKRCKHLVSLKVLAFFQSEETDMIVKDMVKERRQKLDKGGGEALTPNVPTDPTCALRASNRRSGGGGGGDDGGGGSGGGGGSQGGGCGRTGGGAGGGNSDRAGGSAGSASGTSAGGSRSGGGGGIGGAGGAAGRTSAVGGNSDSAQRASRRRQELPRGRRSKDGKMSMRVSHFGKRESSPPAGDRPSRQETKLSTRAQTTTPSRHKALHKSRAGQLGRSQSSPPTQDRLPLQETKLSRRVRSTKSGGHKALHLHDIGHFSRKQSSSHA